MPPPAGTPGSVPLRTQGQGKYITRSVEYRSQEGEFHPDKFVPYIPKRAYSTGVFGGWRRGWGIGRTQGEVLRYVYRGLRVLRRLK